MVPVARSPEGDSAEPVIPSPALDSAAASATSATPGAGFEHVVIRPHEGSDEAWPRDAIAIPVALSPVLSPAAPSNPVFVTVDDEAAGQAAAAAAAAAAGIRRSQTEPIPSNGSFTDEHRPSLPLGPVPFPTTPSPAHEQQQPPHPTRGDRPSSITVISVLLWVGALFHWFSMGFYIVGTIYDVWLEESDGSPTGKTITRLGGKGTTQWVLCAAAVACGLSGAAFLTARVFGVPSSKPWFKPAAVLCCTGMNVTGWYAFATFNPALLRSSPDARLGAGAEYVDQAFKYSMLALVSMVLHEIFVRLVQRMRIRRHLAAETARALRAMRDQPEEVQHAIQREAIAAMLAKEEARIDHERLTRGTAEEMASPSPVPPALLVVSPISPLSPSPLPVYSAPPNSRPTGGGGGAGDEHLQRLLSRALQDKDKLSVPQLNLLFSLVVFLYTIQGGSLIYAHVEGWDLRQALQYCVVTTATIGYGDVAPRTTVGRALLFLYFPLGFGVMSYTISLVWSQVFAKFDENLRAVYHLFAVYIIVPLKSHRRKKNIRQLQQRRHAVHVARRIHHQRKASRLRSLSNASELHSTRARGGGHSNPASPRAARGLSPSRLHAVKEEGDEHHVEMAAGMPNSVVAAAGAATAAAPRPAAVSFSWDTAPDSKGTSFLTPDEARAHAAAEASEEAEALALDNEEKALDAEEAAALNAMASLSIEPAARSPASLNYKLALSGCFCMVLLFGGAALFLHWEPEWTFFEAVYFCFVTLTTIGYGDFAPTQPATKTLVIYYALTGLGALAYVLALTNEKITQGMERTTKGAQVEDEQPAAGAAEEKQAKAAALEGETHEAALMRSFSSLPSWNERFLALQFEMEKLDEQASALSRTAQPLPPSFVHAMHALNTTLASLTLTVNQRIVDAGSRSGSRRSSRIGADRAARQQNGTQDATAAAAAEEDDDDDDDEIDLSFYGIGRTGSGANSNGTAQQETPAQQQQQQQPLLHSSSPLQLQHGGSQQAPAFVGKKKVQRAALPRHAPAAAASTLTRRPSFGLGLIHSPAAVHQQLPAQEPKQ